MKRIFTLFLLWLLLPIPSQNDAGTFNEITGLFWCTDGYSCLHEQAHFIDKSNGWISQSQEYQEALQIYTISELGYQPGPLAYQIAKMLGNPIVEIYADIYALTGGDVPDNLKLFYLASHSFWIIQLPKGTLNIPEI